MQKLYIETYGCQMNVSDSEVVASILQSRKFEITDNINSADLILVNTCSIRDNAEQRIMTRLNYFKGIKKKRRHIMVGIIGCMAERLKEELLKEDVVNLVVGPDSYRNLPELIEQAQNQHKSIDTELSKEETYKDILPVRLDKNGISAYVSIMRGCNNFCTYCVVPYTRGRERSRDPETILEETLDVINQGYKEITLLGQNVNSYEWETSSNEKIDFPKLLEIVAQQSPQLRVRFSTSHPKDISDSLIETVAKYPNICKHIHLPIQSGSDNMLSKMNRKYTQEWYLQKIETIKKLIPECSITTDIITGFCDETEQDHHETLKIMELVGYDFAYMFKYSQRPGTVAAEKFIDNISEETKSNRLSEIIDLQGKLSRTSNLRDVEKTFEVLVEGESKKSNTHFYGRTTYNKVVVFPKRENVKIGDFVDVKIKNTTRATLIGY